MMIFDPRSGMIRSPCRLISPPVTTRCELSPVPCRKQPAAVVALKLPNFTCWQVVPLPWLTAAGDVAQPLLAVRRLAAEAGGDDLTVVAAEAGVVEDREPAAVRGGREIDLAVAWPLIRRCGRRRTSAPAPALPTRSQTPSIFLNSLRPDHAASWRPLGSCSSAAKIGVESVRGSSPPPGGRNRPRPTLRRTNCSCRAARSSPPGRSGRRTCRSRSSRAAPRAATRWPGSIGDPCPYQRRKYVVPSRFTHETTGRPLESSSICA